MLYYIFISLQRAKKERDQLEKIKEEFLEAQVSIEFV